LTVVRAQHRRRDARVNYKLFFIDAFGYPLAFSLISTSTIMPLLLTDLGASNLAIGLVPAIQSLGALMPGILIAPFLERLPLKKRLFVALGLAERLFILSMAGIVAIWGVAKPSLAVKLFLLAWTLASLMAGINMTVYYAILPKCIPIDQRGGLFGWAGALSGVFGIIGAETAGYILETVEFPRNFALLFIMAFVILIASLVQFIWLREPPDEKSEGSRSVKEYIAAASYEVREDRAYVWTIAALAVMAFAMSATSFYSTYAVRLFGAGTRDVGRLTAFAVGATIVGMPALGWIADREGHKLSLEITAACFACGAALALAANNVTEMYPAVVFANIGMSGIAVSHNLILAEFAPTHTDVPMYTAFSWMLLAPFRTGAPILGGYISDIAGFPAMFSISLAAGIVAVCIFLFAVEEPRRA
jgi:MFS family permease